MTGYLDVAARLADGWAAVDAAQAYVSACESLGYQQPELTHRSGQVHEWYGTEQGLDLGALAADSAALARAAGTAAEALAVQDAQVAALEVTWLGAGGQAARAALRRHGEAAAAATAALHTAAEVLATLRTELWQLVDRKVTATQDIDGGGRTDWQAAAHTVLTGAGDRSVASELVDGEVKPFVDDVIGCDWLRLMNETLTSIEARFDSAIAELKGAAGAGFTAGDELAWDRPSTTAPSWPMSSWAPATEPASAVSAPVGPGPSEPVTPAAPTPLPGPGLPAPPVAGAGTGLPDLGSGLSTVGSQLVELLGGLFGPAGDALGSGIGALDAELDGDDLRDSSHDDPAARESLDDADRDDPDEDGADEDDPDEGSHPDGDPADREPADEPEDPAAAPAVAAAEPAEPVAVATPPPAPTPAPPAPTPPDPAPPPPAADTVAGTPCEIAAAELPQVGE
ncbi:hypothetical protein [Mycolicibacterium thermoresistibile]